MEGKSLAPLFRNPKARVRDSVFLAYRHVQRGVRTDDWKLILYNVGGKQTTQLFDLRNDPWEIKNLAAQEPGRVKEMLALLRQWMKQVEDPLDLEQTGLGLPGLMSRNFTHSHGVCQPS